MSTTARNRNVFFHVTHRRLLGSIWKHGLLCSKDRRGKGRIWVCKVSELEWACKHVAETHKWDYNDLAVVGIKGYRIILHPRRRAIFYALSDIPTEALFVAYA